MACLVPHLLSPPHFHRGILRKMSYGFPPVRIACTDKVPSQEENTTRCVFFFFPPCTLRAPVGEGVPPLHDRTGGRTRGLSPTDGQAGQTKVPTLRRPFGIML